MGFTAVSGVLTAKSILPFITIYAPMLQVVGYLATAFLEISTFHPVLIDPENQSIYWSGSIMQTCADFNWNLILGTLMSLGVFLTDFIEYGGAGAFSASFTREVSCRLLDMDYINVILAGMQGGMESLGMVHVEEWGVADMMKFFLGLAGVRFGLYPALGFGALGAVSLLPQLDAFYHSYIWPIAKFAVGSSLIGGPMALLGSTIANTVAFNGLSAVENAWMNGVVGLPWYQDATFDFGMFAEYLPGSGEASILHQIFNWIWCNF